MEADLSDPEINNAYLDVRSDASDTNWLLLDYVSPMSDTLRVSKTGTGGLAELQEALDDGTASYAYARVKYANDKESERQKFILVVWIGPGCKVMRRAKVSVHATNVKRAMPIYSLDVPARERDDLAEGPIIVRLRKAGGASYDRV
ncbi:hypothetical protein BD779DRAFT_1623030 [Infundibulicybe gibba]|nr:hypothetical protein BD779DRAFT_1623030 [Infundibulicybe gibba]